MCYPRVNFESYADKDLESCKDYEIWTLSQDLNECGWETDCGCPGYGLTKADAELIAARWNAGLPNKESNNE